MGEATLDDAGVEAPVEKEGIRGTRYVVLREIESVEELGKLLESGDIKVYAEVYRTTARDRKHAAREYAEAGQGTPTGRYKSIPESSWKTYRPQNLLQLLEEDD